MVKLYDGGVYLVNGREIVTDPAALPGKCGRNVTKEEAEQGTIAYGILKAHNKSGDMQNLRMRFDSLTSHDITYVGIIQGARIRHEEIPDALRADQLPQQPVRRRRHHQRG